MDFLPGLDSIQDESIQVPLVVDVHRPLEATKDYSVIFQATREELPSSIQSTLFLGLLGALCGEPLDFHSIGTSQDSSYSEVKHVLAQDEIRDVISAICLKFQNAFWYETSQYQEILHLADDASIGIQSIVEKETNPTLSIIYTSAQVLISFLLSVIKPRYRDNGLIPRLPTPEWPYHMMQPRATGRVFRDFMLMEGWCQHQVRKILRNFPCHIVNCFALLRRHTPNVSLADCKLDKCLGWTIADSAAAAMPKHITPECQCQMLTISSTDVAHIIRAGGVPLVSVQKDSKGKLALRLHRKGIHTRYVAISHVWHDGLGNPNANGLPECQIHQLARVLSGSTAKEGSRWKSVAKYKYFWMDTLCIPPRSSSVVQAVPDFDKIKNTAIQSMGRIYGAASRTLVLDSELQRTLDCETPVPIILARIYCSGWNSRGWTLQEGNLARSTYFAVKDGAVDPDWMIWDLTSPYPIQMRPRQKRIRPKRPPSDSQGYDVLFCERSFYRIDFWSYMAAFRLSIIWDSLVERTTAKPADVPAIMANLGHFKAFEVLRLPPHQRLASMLLAEKQIPLGFLFQSGPRLRPAPPTTSSIRSLDTLEPPMTEREEILSRFMEKEKGFWTNSWLPEQIVGDLVSECEIDCNLSAGSLHLKYDESLGMLSINTPQHLPPKYIISATVNVSQSYWVQTLPNGDWEIDDRRQLASEHKRYLVLEPVFNKLEPGSFSKGAQLIALDTPGYAVYECPVRVTLLDDSSSSKAEVTSQKSTRVLTPIFEVQKLCEDVSILFDPCQLPQSQTRAPGYGDAGKMPNVSIPFVVTAGLAILYQTFVTVAALMTGGASRYIALGFLFGMAPLLIPYFWWRSKAKDRAFLRNLEHDSERVKSSLFVRLVDDFTLRISMLFVLGLLGMIAYNALLFFFGTSEVRLAVGLFLGYCISISVTVPMVPSEDVAVPRILRNRTHKVRRTRQN